MDKCQVSKDCNSVYVNQGHEAITSAVERNGNEGGDSGCSAVVCDPKKKKKGRGGKGGQRARKRSSGCRIKRGKKKN